MNIQIFIHSNTIKLIDMIDKYVLIKHYRPVACANFYHMAFIFFLLFSLLSNSFSYANTEEKKTFIFFEEKKEFNDLS